MFNFHISLREFRYYIVSIYFSFLFPLKLHILPLCHVLFNSTYLFNSSSVSNGFKLSALWPYIIFAERNAATLERSHRFVIKGP